MLKMTTVKFRIPDKQSREFQKILEQKKYVDLGILCIEPHDNSQANVVFSIVIPCQKFDWVDELTAYAYDLGGDLFYIS